MEIGKSIHSANAKEAINAPAVFTTAKVPFAILGKDAKASPIRREVQPSRSKPKQRKPIIVKHNDKIAVAYRDKDSGKVTHVVVVSKEHFKYAIQKLSNYGEFTSGRHFIMPFDNPDHAEAVFNVCKGLSEFAAEPIALAYVSDKVYVVFRNDSFVQYTELQNNAKLMFVAAVMARLAFLHNSGICTGGLSPEAVLYDGKRAKVKNPAKLEAMP